MQFHASLNSLGVWCCWRGLSLLLIPASSFALCIRSRVYPVKRVFFSSWTSRFVLADSAVTGSTEPVQGGCWGRRMVYPRSNNQVLDCLTMHLWYISAFNRSLEGTICSHTSELWHFCMASLRGQRSRQKLAANCLAFRSAVSHHPRVRQQEGRNALAGAVDEAKPAASCQSARKC